MVKVLQVTTHNLTVKKLLLPLIDRLTAEGYQVVSVCCPGGHTSGLRKQGYSIRSIVMNRQVSPMDSLRIVRDLYRLMRAERPDIVHVHTPIAAALGRVAARLARVPIIIYTAHGFFFHERMPWRTKKAYIWIEKLLARFTTDMLFTQSQEDAATAVSEGIYPAYQVMWIGNGVDMEQFTPSQSAPAFKEAFGIPASAPVVGFIGRLVEEKGVLELLDAFRQALSVMPELRLLMVGDNTVVGHQASTIHDERDRRTREFVRSKVETLGLASSIVFTGYVEDVTKLMPAIDVFVLPSHREGMPRIIIEAMASGKPVIATDIRGCREEVVHDLTGLLVPVGDTKTLSEAMVRILSEPELACRMGCEGRRRAEAMFDERDVLDRQVRVYQQLVKERLSQGVVGELNTQASGVPYGEGREISES